MTSLIATLPVGAHPITVMYAGDAAFAPNTSPVLTETVGKAATKTIVTTSATPVVHGIPVTFTAVVTVVAPGAGVPTGTVTFVNGTSALGTVPLDPTTGLVKQVPGYVVLNAMARYTLTDNLSLQANIFNLANRNYIDEIHPAHIVPGAGTSGLFGLNFRF